jgi:hypothetical protein
VISGSLKVNLEFGLPHTIIYQSKATNPTLFLCEESRLSSEFHFGWVYMAHVVEYLLTKSEALGFIPGTTKKRKKKKKKKKFQLLI